mmetsp:Transcript_22357/g.53120  ORF Transcript_22357/g.53120 Transcript_22357/m.53120 type:complete len:295 (+) Transcript_22357:266-1150(+)
MDRARMFSNVLERVHRLASVHQCARVHCSVHRFARVYHRAQDRVLIRGEERGGRDERRTFQNLLECSRGGRGAREGGQRLYIPRRAHPFSVPRQADRLPVLRRAHLSRGGPIPQFRRFRRFARVRARVRFVPGVSGVASSVLSSGRGAGGFQRCHVEGCGPEIECLVHCVQSLVRCIVPREGRGRVEWLGEGRGELQCPRNPRGFRRGFRRRFPRGVKRGRPKYPLSVLRSLVDGPRGVGARVLYGQKPARQFLQVGFGVAPTGGCFFSVGDAPLTVGGFAFEDPLRNATGVPA